MDFQLILSSVLLGVGLSMDAFSASVANGLSMPCLNGKKSTLIAVVFAVFQAIMPLIGYFCVHAFIEHFKIFEKAIPYIALALLSFIGIKMIVDGVRHKDEESSCKQLTFPKLLLQGLATSIDALSVGFTIATYTALQAVISALIIGVITFGMCLAGVIIGQKIGNKLSNKAEIIGGAILIAIGLEIFITSFF